ncbi:hypothetical protein V8E53_011684 [Lactarius tabidus]
MRSGGLSPASSSIYVLARRKGLSDSFNRLGVITQYHRPVNDRKLYKHIDSELLNLTARNNWPCSVSFGHSTECDTFRLDTRAIDYPSPKPDFIDLFVDLYFTHINLFLPYLHRPTFEHHLHDGLHFRDQAFVSAVLCLCACASRYSGDLRMLLDTTAWHSSGWKLFGQAQRLRQSLMGPRLPHDVRVGARRLSHVGRWLGVFGFFRMLESTARGLGRSGAMASPVLGSYRPGPADECVSWLTKHDHDDGFDIDLPTEIADKYLEHEQDTEQVFKRPPGKQSLLSYFVCFIKLDQILAVVLSTIHPKVFDQQVEAFLGFAGPHWEQLVAELDSALDESIDMVPNHLKWDTTGQTFRELVWFLQFASLYSHYYHLQILVHRPFIPSPQKHSPLSFLCL